MYQLADACRKQAGYLQDLFAAVSGTNDAVPKIERYRKAVAAGDGTRIESVLQDLLERAVGVGVAPLVSDELGGELQDAPPRGRRAEAVVGGGPSGDGDAEQLQRRRPVLPRRQGTSEPRVRGHPDYRRRATNYFDKP